jgi:excisionase family DNA binding protein
MWNENEDEYEREKRLHRRHELLDRYDMAERLGVSADTISKWARQGRIPAIRITRKVVRFDHEQITAALRRQAAKTFAPPAATGEGNAAKAES